MGAVLKVIWDATDLDFKKLNKKEIKVRQRFEGEKKKECLSGVTKMLPVQFMYNSMNSRVV